MIFIRLRHMIQFLNHCFQVVWPLTLNLHKFQKYVNIILFSFHPPYRWKNFIRFQKVHIFAPGPAVLLQKTGLKGKPLYWRYQILWLAFSGKIIISRYIAHTGLDAENRTLILPALLFWNIKKFPGCSIICYKRSDITGFNVYDPHSVSFSFRPGPAITNVLLADEINRTIPRTQSSLLECMEERQVTVDGETSEQLLKGIIDRIPVPAASG